MDDSSLTKSRALGNRNDVLSSIICGIEDHLLMYLRHLLTKAERLLPSKLASSF
jgi:hypothetical protein